MQTIDPVACGLFLIAAFVLAGFAQVAWFASSWSRRFALPLDGGLTFGGRPVFGANKTLRGFVIMVPAAALAFALLALAARGPNTHAAGLWPLTLHGYALLGAWAGLGFMAGELPNSFVKRQLGIAPGAATGHRRGVVWQFVGDRLDSGIGMLLATSMAVRTPWQTWATVLVLGPLFHWLFGLLLFRLGVKPRPA